MNTYIKISLVVLAIAFGTIMWQNGKATTITIIGVAPLAIWTVGLTIVGIVNAVKKK